MRGVWAGSASNVSSAGGGETVERSRRATCGIPSARLASPRTAAPAPRLPTATRAETAAAPYRTRRRDGERSPVEPSGWYVATPPSSWSAVKYVNAPTALVRSTEERSTTPGAKSCPSTTDPTQGSAPTASTVRSRRRGSTASAPPTAPQTPNPTRTPATSRRFAQNWSNPMRGTTMKPGMISMTAWPRASGANAKPRRLTRNARSSAKNIASVPTSRPVRPRRSSRILIRSARPPCMGRYAAMSPLPPLTADDLAAFAFVSEAAISTDGARVAYAVRRMDLDANRYRAGLHVSSVDGSSAIAWTDGSVEDASPRWSPDSRAIAFVSDRGVVPEGKKRAPKNVFVVEGPGAEPRQIATFADDCGDLTWLPDGSAVLVTLKDAATPEAEDAPKVYDRVRYKSDEGGLLDMRRTHLWIVPVDPAGACLDPGRPDPVHRLRSGHREPVLVPCRRRRRPRRDARRPSARDGDARPRGPLLRRRHRDRDVTWRGRDRAARRRHARGHRPERRAAAWAVHRRARGRALHRRRRLGHRGLAAEAARLRRGADLAARPGGPRGAPRRVRALVLPRVPGAGRPRLRRALHESTRQPRVRRPLRAGLRRRLGRQGLPGPHGRPRPRRAAGLGRPRPAIRHRGQLRRVHDQLDRRPHRPVQGRGDTAQHQQQHQRVRHERYRLALLAVRD